MQGIFAQLPAQNAGKGGELHFFRIEVREENASLLPALLDYLVRALEHFGRNRDADFLSRLQVHDQLIARYRLYG